MPDPNNDLNHFRALDESERDMDKAHDWSHSEWKGLRGRGGCESISEMDEPVEMLLKVGALVSRHVFVAGMAKETTDYEATVKAIIAMFDKQIDEYGEQYE